MSQDPASSGLEFRSDLAQKTLPEVLATVHRYRVPGIIECTRDDEVKRIFIDNGNIIFATSSDTADSLGDRLLAKGRITREQYDESVRRLGGAGKRQGTILVEMRAIDPNDLFAEVREQVQSIVWSIFQWTHGTVTFRPGREKHHEFIKLEIPIYRALLEGVRHADAKMLLARVGARTTVLELSPETDESIALTADEASLLATIDGKHALSDLIQTPPLAAAENARLIYGFFVLRLVRVKAPKQIKVHIRKE